MVDASSVTRDMIKNCNEMWLDDGVYSDECSSIIQESFWVQTDFDLDWVDPWLGVNTCHGTDSYSPDDPIRWHFTKYINGDVVISGMDSTYVMSGNEIQDLSTGTAANRLPWDVGYFVNVSFYQCYKESGDLNATLTDSMKGVVENFFTAVKNQFPEFFYKACVYKINTTTTQELECNDVKIK